jgi:hypothetical protein
MDAERERWIQIGAEPKQEPLQQAVKKIKQKWPDRFDFRISPTEIPPSDDLFRLYLRHR